MDINVLLRRAGLKASEQEIAVLEKDLENILQAIEQIPMPTVEEEKQVHGMHLAADEYQNDATKEEILKNAKSVEDDMFKVG